MTALCASKRPISKLATATVMVLLALMIGAVVWDSRANRLQAAQGLQGVPIDPNSISGVVLNGGKLEAGVWVIAETRSLPTLFRKIVVTDDQGRFLVPDLPEGAYEVWVRGYGLQDSARVKAARGQRLELQVANAPSPKEAAQLYPSNYWFALYEAPSKEQLPPVFATRAEWLGEMKVDCLLCHQLGNADVRKLTRPEQWKAAWKRSGTMVRAADFLGADVLANSLAAWASRIEGGAVPPVAPPRPAGPERNFVVTQWEWAPPGINVHDEIATDKRNPTLYPYGKIYGGGHNPMLDEMGRLWITTTLQGVRVFALDPKTHRASSYEFPTGGGRGPGADAATPDRGGAKREQPEWAPQVIRSNVALTDAERKRLAGDLHVGNQLVLFDTKTAKFTPIDTRYATHHLQFDQQGGLWTSGLQSNVLGQFLTKEFDPQRVRETLPIAHKAWVDVDPKTRKVITGGGGYGIIVNPLDGTVWRGHPAIFGGAGISGQQDAPGQPWLDGVTRERDGNKLSKFDPRTGTFKYYPLPPPGIGPKGVDVTTDGMIWFSAANGYLGRFNPKTEKFTYWESPGPKPARMGKETGSADYHYYIWVDQFDTLGMGKDKVILNGTTSDSLLIFDPRTERFSVVRVPYPMDFYTRGLDGRIDDPKAGWKGRGLWANHSSIPARHHEDQKNSLNHIQYRPDPLAH